jgi:type IV secretory pathway VirB2 component (pilin)
MRGLAATGLLLLGGLDLAGALLVSPSTWAVLVHDPVRPWLVTLLRALAAVGPGAGLAAVLSLTCAVGAGAVLARQDWARVLGAILAVLHLPLVVVSLPLLWALANLPASPRVVAEPA